MYVCMSSSLYLLFSAVLFLFPSPPLSFYEIILLSLSVSSLSNLLIYTSFFIFFPAYFPRTEVIDSPTSVFVLIHPEDPAHPPFIIENMTDRTIRYMQEGDSHTDSLGSGERYFLFYSIIVFLLYCFSLSFLPSPGSFFKCFCRASYAWDQPLDRHALLVDCWGEKGEHGRMRCKISKIVPFKPLKVSTPHLI